MQLEMKKQLRMFGIGFLCALILSVTIGYAQTILTPMTLTRGIYPAAPTYTVFKEGTDYFAKDSHGNIDYSGTNESLVILNSISTLSNGGSILLTNANYSITACLNLTNHGNDISLIGQGKNTLLWLANAINKPVIYARQQSGVQIKNLKIVGNKAHQSGGSGVSGIRFQGVTDFILDTLWIESTYHQGIDIVDNAVTSTISQRGIIKNIYTFQTGSAGIYVGYESKNIVVDTAFLREAGRGAGGSGIDRDGLILSGETNYLRNVTINNIWGINNTRYGISFWASEFVTGTNLYAIENGDDGVFFASLNHYIDLKNVQATGNTGNGISIYAHANFPVAASDYDWANHHITIQGYSMNNLGDGIKLSGYQPTYTYPYPHDIDLSINAIENSLSGIGLAGYSTSSLEDIEYVSIHDCIIRDNSQASAGVYNGILLHWAGWVQISNVMISGTSQAWGIYESATSKGYNTINGVNAWTYATGGISRHEATTHVLNSFNGTSWIANSP